MAWYLVKYRDNFTFTYATLLQHITGFLVQLMKYNKVELTINCIYTYIIYIFLSCLLPTLVPLFLPFLFLLCLVRSLFNEAILMTEFI